MILEEEGGEKHKEFIIHRLTEIYEMEELLSQILSQQLKSLEDYPQAKETLEHHFESLRYQMNEVNGCLKRLNGSRRIKKSRITDLLKEMEDKQIVSYKDRMVEDLIFDLAIWEWQIASFKTVVFAALHFGDQETVSICRSILGEDRVMAKEVDGLLPPTVQDTLHRHYGI